MQSAQNISAWNFKFLWIYFLLSVTCYCM